MPGQISVFVFSCQVKSLHESSLKMKVQSSVEFMNQKVSNKVMSDDVKGGNQEMPPIR